MKKVIALALALIMVFAFEASAVAEAAADPVDPITIRFATVFSTASHYGRAVEKFKTLIEEKSNGAILVDCFYDSILGDESTMIQSQKEGGIELSFSAASGIGLYVEATQILEAWYAYETVDDVKALFDSISDQLDEVYQTEGFKLLGAFYDGYRCFLTKKPVTCMDDLKGMKIRAPGNQMFSGCIAALGAQAVPMAFSDVYTALQTGAVNGAENTVDTIYSSKWYEQAKCLIWDCHVWTPQSITANLDWWNSLSADQQALIQECMNEAIDYQIELFNSVVQEELEAMKAEGLEVYEITDRPDWVAAVQDNVSMLAEEFGDLGVQIYNAQKAAQS